MKEIDEEFKYELESVIKNAFQILRGANVDAKSRLVFPNYVSGKRRVCEQELRFVFIEQLQELLKKYDYYYSVETPTKDKYTFTKNRRNDKCIMGKGKSASFDLTIGDKKKNIAIIEFKAKSASSHEYAKDLCKLWNREEEGEYRYIINIYEKMTKETLERLRKKLLDTDWYDHEHMSEFTNRVHFIAQSISSDDACFYYDKELVVKEKTVQELSV